MNWELRKRLRLALRQKDGETKELTLEDATNVRIETKRKEDSTSVSVIGEERFQDATITDDLYMSWRITIDIGNVQIVASCTRVAFP